VNKITSPARFGVSGEDEPVPRVTPAVLLPRQRTTSQAAYARPEGLHRCAPLWDIAVAHPVAAADSSYARYVPCPATITGPLAVGAAADGLATSAGHREQSRCTSSRSTNIEAMAGSEGRGGLLARIVAGGRLTAVALVQTST
jgi:hypothetical protein